MMIAPRRQALRALLLGAALIGQLAGHAVQAEVRIPPTPVEAAALYGTESRFRITRNGTEVGEHVISFSQEDDKLSVDVRSGITVRVLKIPVFKFAYRSSEVWLNNTLASVASRTDENGKITTVSLTNSGTTATLDANGKRTQVPQLYHASNHWNAAALQGTRLFNTITGKASDVRVIKLETVELALPWGSSRATHYRYTGDIKADAWYTDDGRWVKLSFDARDGSRIEYLAK